MGKSKIENVIRRLFGGVLVFSFAFIVALLSGSHFAPVSDGSAAPVSVVNQATGYYANITSIGNIELTIQSTPDGAYKVGKDTLTIDTNTTVGYKLYISTVDHSSDSPALPSDTPSNGLIDSASGSYLSPSTGAADTPVRLAVNTWGYVPSRSTSSEASVEYTDADAAPTEDKGGKSVWRAVPEYGNEDIFYTNTNPSSSSSATGDTNTVDIYYAVNASTALPSGTYSNTVVYTAIVDGGTDETGDTEASISPVSQDGLSAGQEVTIATSLYPGLSLSNLGDITVKIGDNDCMDITPALTEIGSLNLTCKAPAQTAAGAYTVTITISKYDKTYTLDNAYSYNTTFSLTYDYNSGTGTISPNPETKTIAATSADFIIPDSTPTRTGYTFLGWSEDQTAATATYTAGDTFTLDSTSHNDNSATLYSVWDWPTYTNLSTGCSNTIVGNQYYYVYNGSKIAYIKLADNHCWTKDSQGTATWASASSLCTGKGSVPSREQWSTLRNLMPNEIYQHTDWSFGWTWTSTFWQESYAWAITITRVNDWLGVDSTSDYTITNSYHVICIGA